MKLSNDYSMSCLKILQRIGIPEMLKMILMEMY